MMVWSCISSSVWFDATNAVVLLPPEPQLAMLFRSVRKLLYSPKPIT